MVVGYSDLKSYSERKGGRQHAGGRTKLSPYLNRNSFLILADQYDAGKSVQESRSGTFFCYELQGSTEAVPIST